MGDKEGKRGRRRLCIVNEGRKRKGVSTEEERKEKKRLKEKRDW